MYVRITTFSITRTVAYLFLVDFHLIIFLLHELNTQFFKVVLSTVNFASFVRN